MRDPWPAPDENEEENVEYQWAVVRSGLYFIIFSILLYSLFVWVAAGILKNSEIISGRLSWTGACSLVGMWIFYRIWNKTFFK